MSQNNGYLELVRRKMERSEIVDFLKTKVEPIPHRIYGNRYRAAAYLKDGTYLPCVVFQGRLQQVNLACQRFDELRENPQEYRSVVESFVSNGSHVADWAIDRVELSPFAWPIHLLETIEGETTVGWTAFVVEMDDGRRFSYGTQFDFEFFALPDGYQHCNIKIIHSGMVQTNDGRTVPFSILDHLETQVIRERQHFTCFLDELNGGDVARTPLSNPSLGRLLARMLFRD